MTSLSRSIAGITQTNLTNAARIGSLRSPGCRKYSDGRVGEHALPVASFHIAAATPTDPEDEAS